MRIELWKWNLKALYAVGNHLDKFPLYTIVPYETARRMMAECDFDLEIFAQSYINVRCEGTKIWVKGLDQYDREPK